MERYKYKRTGLATLVTLKHSVNKTKEETDTAEFDVLTDVACRHQT
jgi:hypothetical protein